MSYYEIKAGVIAKDAIQQVEQLQVKIFTELKKRAIDNQNRLPPEGREAYILGFTRAIDSIISIINTDLTQQEILETDTITGTSMRSEA